MQLPHRRSLKFRPDDSGSNIHLLTMDLQGYNLASELVLVKLIR